jgi:hypothetical protein
MFAKFYRNHEGGYSHRSRLWQLGDVVGDQQFRQLFAFARDVDRTDERVSFPTTEAGFETEDG